MRTFIFVISILGLTPCDSSSSVAKTKIEFITENVDGYLIAVDTISQPKVQRKPSVLIMPPFDPIANRGISPDMQKYLEEELSKDTNLTVITFPYRKLMNVPYQNVFDKKYCKPVIDKIEVDKIIMTKLNQVVETGNMETDKWSIRIRIYDTHTDKQTNSKLVMNGSTSAEIRKVLAARHKELVAEIRNNR